MAGPPSNVPGTPVTPIRVDSNYPALVKAGQLDNPPRSRFSVPATSPALNVNPNPFQNLPVMDLINIKAALEARAAALGDDPQANPEHITSTGRMLTLVSAKFAPKIPAGVVSVAPGVRPMPVVQRPPTS